ncbi:MAG TPA: hypothetical protein VK203_18955 [Nostocaceae cyanobacterium]|nr:hypothetical protein [Nostocaceae cyanobacterium]
MNRLFSILASCVLAIIIAFGSLVGEGFAQNAASPNKFTISPFQSQIVKFSPVVRYLSFVFEAPNIGTTVSVKAGPCSENIPIPPTKCFNFDVSICGNTAIFTNERPGLVNVTINPGKCLDS